MPSIISPLPISYATLPDRENLIDARQLGKSIAGIGKVSNSVIHFLLRGEVTSDPRLSQVRFYVGPPRKGSILYEASAIVVVTQLPLWWPLFCEVAELTFQKMLKAVFSWRIGDRDATKKMIDLLAEELKRRHEYTQMVHQGQMEDKHWLQAHIDRLTAVNRSSLGEVASPVGRSSGPLRIGDESSDESVFIDEPIAEVLRAREDLEVGETQQLTVVLHGVDKINGACRVEIVSEGGNKVKGRITDPALAAPGNVYTRSLDRMNEIVVTAKPVLKEGRVTTLYISDARELD